MVIYLDVLMLENLIVNYFLMYITAQELRVKVKARYLFLAAAFGSSYVLVLIYNLPLVFNSLIFKILITIIMIGICFRKRELKFNIKAVGLLILNSMILSGICIFIEFCIEKDSLNNASIKNFSYKYLLIAIFISYIFIHRLFTCVKDRMQIGQLVYDVDIEIDKNIKKVKAFLDTGNELKEPATNLPVMIVEREVFTDVKLSKNNKYYIPYKVIDGNSGLLEGFKPTKVNIHDGKNYYTRDIIVAFSNNKLSDISEYNALLSRGIL